MRGELDGLIHPHPLGVHVPGLFQDDDITQRVLRSLDAVTAPIVWTMDNLHAYLDPWLAPADHLPALAGWVGLELDFNWDEAKRRRMIASAVDQAQWHGTKQGIINLVRTYTAVGENDVEVEDTGGVAWSATPNGELPGDPSPAMRVVIRTDEPDAIDVLRVDRLVARSRPAHVRHVVEVVSR